MSSLNVGVKDLNPGPRDYTASTFIHWGTFSGPPEEYINPVKDNGTANRLFKNWLFEGKKKSIFHSGGKNWSYDMKSNLKDYSHLDQKTCC